MNIIKLENKLLKERFNTNDLKNRGYIARDYIANFVYYSINDKIARYKELEKIKFRSNFISNEFRDAIKKECFFNICKTLNIDNNKILTSYFLHKEIELLDSLSAK